MITEREKLEFESLPEFVREPRPTRESYTQRTAAAPRTTGESAKPAAPQPRPETFAPKPAPEAAAPEEEAPLPKSAELEALWPGVNHEFFHAAPKKGPSFYLTIGFAAGAICSWLGIWGFTAVSHITSANNGGGKEIVVAQATRGNGRATEGGAAPAAPGEAETIVPLTPSYTVGNGDTLAGIALKNYHRATPRLLDEICRANNMRNANVLSLGQKLNLPEYHPSRQIATGVNQVSQ